MLVREDFGACMERVDQHLNLKEVAKRSEIFHFGMKGRKKLKFKF